MLQNTRLHIPSMRSTDATRQVSDALVNVQGVADLGVNGAEGIVEVRYDPGRTNVSALIEAVDLAGHHPHSRS